MSFTTSPSSILRGELARRSGCHLETVRYYENIGLLPAPARSKAGHRLYSETDQRRLRFIQRGRELGFSIAELRSLLSLADTKSYSCGEIHALTMDHLGGIRQKLADLSQLERTLTTISQDCAGGAVPDCPVIDALWDDPGSRQ